jgi:hypothetical protein
MFEYLMTPLHRHYDYGFGVTADSFKDAADLLEKAPQPEQGLNQHLPVSFLYRHAIELYLKSGIIIFHRKFKLAFGTNPHDGPPQVLINQNWKLMYHVHSIADLYSYWRHLFEQHRSYLEHHTKTDWSFPKELDDWISEIESHDPTSTFYRYPVTKDATKDPQKSVMKEAHYLDIMAKMGPDSKPVKAVFVADQNEEIVESYFLDDGPVAAVIDTLRRTSELLSGCHTATRAELTDGW